MGDFVRFMDEGCPPLVIIARGAALPLWSSRWGRRSLVVVAAELPSRCDHRDADFPLLWSSRWGLSSLVVVVAELPSRCDHRDADFPPL